ncbi:ion transporter [Pseudomaricurvus alkylphenolicus]|jgi:voltage-gated potassium channel|uniref:ion transporter n=1 Tax=Pseudomaricurvus alkylphenolicus TaxID=1306991 RepID=UPI00141F65D5|nr:ion transporter [Pseudomaricurvus alkylphenolicus]NIB42017.1 ion transporter [Pseudomaricurvus alkylphenolicus]
MAQSPLQIKLHSVIFGTGTKAGKRFDVALIYAIVLSVLAMMLESIGAIERAYGPWLYGVEWAFTAIFTVEYLLRIYCSPNPWRYIRSFYGLVDLLAILPSYLGLFVADMNYLLMIRLLRVLRIFRVLKLVRYLSEANILMRAMMMSRRKILVFFSSVLVLATIFGSLMFVVEGPEHGFTSIPKSIYWTIVTITTVGYGDITPQTSLGQLIAAAAMLTGYSIIAVPTGILTAELTTEMQRERSLRRCSECSSAGHDSDALYCKQCGSTLTD